MPPWVTDGQSDVLTTGRGGLRSSIWRKARLRILGGLPKEGRLRLWIPDWFEVRPRRNYRGEIGGPAGSPWKDE